VDLAAPAGAGWQHEYSFTAAYAQPGVDPASLQTVYYLLLGSPGEYLEKYARYYDVSNLSQDSINQSNLPAYWSAIGQMESSGFLAWYGALTAPPASSGQSEDP
jgi:hypothetical protein